jgi:hypothetical protein
MSAILGATRGFRFERARRRNGDIAGEAVEANRPVSAPSIHDVEYGVSFTLKSIHLRGVSWHSEAL